MRVPTAPGVQLMLRTIPTVRISVAFCGLVLTGWIVQGRMEAQPKPSATKGSPAQAPSKTTGPIREVLSRKVDLKGFSANTAIRDALTSLRDDYGLAFVIDVQAF